MQVLTRTVWFELLKRHRRPFFDYLLRHERRNKALANVANRLTDFLVRSVTNEKQAADFWNAVPAVLAQCDHQETYRLPMAPEAYAWLHLLDRYVRTWSALETMVHWACLPLAVNGVNVLDIGTGPGPSTLAVSDFYSCLSDYGIAVRESELIQPCTITAVELNDENNMFRSRFQEVTMISTAETMVYRDVLDLDMRAERASYRRSLLNQTEYDEYTGRYEYVSRLTEEENQAVERLHRYRLVTISNFLTDPNLLRLAGLSLKRILRELGPGSIVVLIGGKSGTYPAIYEEFDQLASEIGLRRKIADVPVMATPADDYIIIQAALTVAEHVSRYSPMTDGVPVEVQKALKGGARWGSVSNLRVYRRDRYRVPRGRCSNGQ